MRLSHRLDDIISFSLEKENCSIRESFPNVAQHTTKSTTQNETPIPLIILSSNKIVPIERRNFSVRLGTVLSPITEIVADVSWGAVIFV